MRRVPVLTLMSLVAVVALVAAPVYALEITNGPATDDNNRIVGMDGGNIFYNGIVPGGSLESMVPLGLPDVGSVSPDGSSPGGAGLIVTIADADRAIQAEGANTASVPGQLSANLNMDGSYVVSAEDGFNAPYIVSFGAQAGGEMAGVHLLAAPAVDVSLAAADNQLFPAGSAPQGSVDFAGDSATVTVGAGQGNLVIAANTVAVGEYATISFDYEASGPANLAAIAFDGGLNPSAVNYTQLLGPNVATGVKKNIAVTAKSFTGNLLPAFQVVNQGDAEITVEISNYQVIQAGPLNRYAVDTDATADVAALADWNPNVLNQSVGNVSESGGVLTLTAGGDDNLANAFTQPALSGGTATLECAVQAAAGAPADAFFALVLASNTGTLNAYVPASNLPTDSTTHVRVSGTSTDGFPGVLVVQAFNFEAMVSDAMVRIVDDEAGAFDPALLGG